jgi:tagatose 1,6-diphosphate aldolase/sulfofructosephosphate aldolase
MSDTSTDQISGLDAIAGPDGTLAIVAMDQRNTLRRMLTAVDRPTDPDTIRGFKVAVTEALSPAASGILLDPDFGVPAVRDAGALASGCGLLIAAEPPDRVTWEGEPRASLAGGRTAAEVRAMGGDAVKLLVQLRPDRPHRAGEPDLVAEVVDVVRTVVEDCAAVGVPSVVETLLYGLPGEDPLSPGRRSELITESARILSEVGPDLLKLEYPSDAAGCRAVGEAVTVPWAMLSAGMDFDPFLEAIVYACEEGGASGFIAGRVYWKEAVALEGEPRRAFLSGTARSRLERSLEAMAGHARPWAEAAAAR